MQTTGLIQLLLIGLIAASAPLAYVWAKRGGYRKLIWVTLFLTFDLILFGAFTRLTDSGLGCPDWPGCYGTANPIAARAEIVATEAAQPTGPVTLQKAWIEMIHRYLAMAVGVLIIAITAVAWRQRDETRASPWPPTALLLLVCVQGAFGAWTVTLKLMPLVVTLHLLLALALLCSLGWVAVRTGRAGAARTEAASSSRFYRPGWFVLLLLFVQVALGGWVSTNYAVLACPDFPLCNGQLLPDSADFGSGFQLLRPLGVLVDGRHLPLEALVAIHWAHRAFALIVTGAVSAFAFVMLRAPGKGAHEKYLARWLLVLIGLQIATGISNVVFTWPLLVAVAHNGGAAALVLTLTLLLARLGPAAVTLYPASPVSAGATAQMSTSVRSNAPQRNGGLT